MDQVYERFENFYISVQILGNLYCELQLNFITIGIIHWYHALYLRIVYLSAQSHGLYITHQILLWNQSQGLCVTIVN